MRADRIEYHRIRSQFRRLSESSSRSAVRLYADTEELAAEYNRIGAGEFQVLPIPHTASSPVPARRNPNPLNIVYAGDARREKGFHLLPQLVRSIWSQYIKTGRVNFRIQSNFNVTNGEPGIADAVRDLKGYSGEHVSLIPGPLSQHDYEEFLRSADVMILLYDRAEYGSRSSGILAEALCLGIPVVTQAGTWLSRQFLPATVSWLEGLRRGTSQWGIVEFTSPVEYPVLVGASSLSVDIGIPQGALFAILDLRHEQAPNAFVGRFTPGGLPFLMEPGIAVRLPRSPSKQRRLTLRLRSKKSSARLRPNSVTIRFITGNPDHTNDLPRASVGTAAFGFADVVESLSDIIDNYEHYKKTALDFSKLARRSHSASRLIDKLVERS